jgi:hypothetical protein
MSKMSSILIGLVFISVIAGAFNIFMTSMTETNEDFDGFMVNDDVQAEMNTLKNDLESLGSGSLGVFDIIGLLFSSAYSSAKLLFFNSIGLVTSVITATFEKINVNADMGALFISGIATIVLVIIVARVILSTVFKRET